MRCRAHMPKGSKEKFRRISADEHADDEEEDEEKKTGKRRLAAQMAAKLVPSNLSCQLWLPQRWQRERPTEAAWQK